MAMFIVINISARLDREMPIISNSGMSSLAARARAWLLRRHRMTLAPRILWRRRRRRGLNWRPAAMRSPWRRRRIVAWHHFSWLARKRHRRMRARAVASSCHRHRRAVDIVLHRRRPWPGGRRRPCARGIELQSCDLAAIEMWP